MTGAVESVMLSVVIPTFNEVKNIELLFDRLHKVKARLNDTVEIVLVDDNSPDGTADLAERLLSDKGLGRVIRRSGPRMLSWAVMDGVREARGELVAVMDADLSHPPELLPRMVDAIAQGIDVAIASRNVPGGAHAINWPWQRYCASRIANAAAFLLVPVSDAMSGYFVCRRETFLKLTTYNAGFKILLELLVRGSVSKVQEIPYVFEDRRIGVSKLGIRTMWCYAMQWLRLSLYRLRHRGNRLDCRVVYPQIYDKNIQAVLLQPKTLPFTMESVAVSVDKHNLATDKEVEHIYAKNNHISPARIRYHLVIHPIRLLLTAYITRRWRRDGMQGFISEVIVEWSHFLKWAKCWALTLPRKKDRKEFSGELPSSRMPLTRQEEEQNNQREKLSVVYIMKNEETQIRRCLDSVWWADEIVVVDGMSTDQTVKICHAYGAKVISHPFSGSFGEERNIGANAAAHDWILALDADDVVSEKLREAICSMLHDGTRHVAFKLQRKNNFLGHWMRNGGWYHYYYTLYRKSACRFEGRVHHVVKMNGTSGIMDASVLHFPFTSLGQFVSRHNRYTSLESEETGLDIKSSNLRQIQYQMMWKPIKLVWKSYFKKQGFREGWHGFIFAMLYGWVHFLKWSKRWERNYLALHRAKTTNN